MKFLVYRCTEEPDLFVVTDDEHADQLLGKACPSGKLEKVGEYDEMGPERAAFDERIARSSIRHQGFYRFEAKTFDPVVAPPGPMPI